MMREMPMQRSCLTLLALAVTCPALADAPPGLRSAVAEWAAPRTVARFQFSLVDLNKDNSLDAVVHVTDPAACGNGGCPLLVFQGTGTGFQRIASSGMVRKPIYLLNEVHGSWQTLGAVIGFGDAAGMVPIRYRPQQQGYRSKPYLESNIDLTTPRTDRVLAFEETE
jgi:hypothetical protein